jgi:branched-chain amino acid transport system ATP-binding protein
VSGCCWSSRTRDESLAIADRGYLIENGKITGSGTAAALQSDDAVRRAYLGGLASGAA